MADTVIEQVALAIGRIGRAPAIGGQPECRSNRRHDAVKLRLRDEEAFAVRGRARINQMVDVQRRFVRTNDGGCDICGFDITPGARIAIDAAVAPADHGVRAVKIAICKMLRSDQVRQILTRSRHWHNQADMHAVGLDKNGYTPIWLSPIIIGGNEAAPKGGKEKHADN